MEVHGMDKPTIGLIRNKCFVDGQWIGEGRLPVTNKATGDVITRVPESTEGETRRAIEAAHTALPGWSKLLARERSKIIRAWYDSMLEHADELALLLSSEQGKPLAEAKGEILYAAAFIEFFAEEAKRVYGETIPTFKADARIVVIKQPVGVVAAITPWNFPAAMITRKAGPALAVGCTMVLKPASETPLTALALAALAEKAGLPKGVFNVITGKASVIGKELTGNPLIRMLTFTGSTEVGRTLMAQCAPSIKKLGLELGGNAPFIVFDDADLDKAVVGAMASKYRNAGQTCVCANRIYVQDKVYDSFAQKLVAEVKKMRVGAGTEEGVTTGPLINKAAVEKVEEHIADALNKGAKVVLGGKRHARGGNFYEPTVLADATVQMKVASEETFGPVAPLFRFKTEDEAIRLANATPYGLAAYFYSRDVGRVWRVSAALEAGVIGANEGIVATELAPFGGVKESGYGREGSLYGLEDYLHIKYVCMGGLAI
jgi:succinate-semialdehyde dehydrogenase / glutarate-semialdehyde dehydrogenase